MSNKNAKIRQNSTMILNYLLTFIIIVLFMTEAVKSHTSHKKQMSFPLSKSLGFSIRKDFGKTLDDARDQEYLKLYNEMFMDSRDVARLEKDVDMDNYALTRNKERAQRRRAARMHSSVHQRQIRSQALRREKLNNQSVKSHYEYSRPRQSISEE